MWVRSKYYVAGAISSQNNNDDDTINKGIYAIKQKMASEREVSSNSKDIDML